jgi:hypothetical protein
MKVVVRAGRRPPLSGTRSWRLGSKLKAGKGKGRHGGGSGRVGGGATAWGEREARRLEGDGGAEAWGTAAPWPPWKITKGRE